MCLCKYKYAAKNTLAVEYHEQIGEYFLSSTAKSVFKQHQFPNKYKFVLKLNISGSVYIFINNPMGQKRERKKRSLFGTKYSKCAEYKNKNSHIFDIS